MFVSALPTTRVRTPAMAVVAVAALLAVLPLGASARGVSNDLQPSLSFTALVSTPGARSTESLRLSISPFLFWDGGESADVRLRVTLPAGIRWAAKAPGAAEGCTRAEEEAVCSRSVTPTSGTNLAATYGVWHVVAEREGSYTFEATILGSSRPDPNSANDSASLTVSVRNAPGGVTLKPRLPKAGSALVASHRVLILDNEGRTFPVFEGAVTCCRPDRPGQGEGRGRSQRRTGDLQAEVPRGRERAHRQRHDPDGIEGSRADETVPGFPRLSCRGESEEDPGGVRRLVWCAPRARTICETSPVDPASDWPEVDDALEREFLFASYPDAIAFVNRLAELAERENHHPDIAIRYTRVTVRWSTHTAGAVTERDRALAALTDGL